MNRQKINRLGQILLLCTLMLLVLNGSPAEAIEPAKIVLPQVADRSGYSSPELNSALHTKLRSQFRFPRYEIVILPALSGTLDRAALEKVTADQKAAGLVQLEISALRNWMRSGLFDDEIYEETDLLLTLIYYEKKENRFARIAAQRRAVEIAGVFSGPVPLALDALEELLNKLDPVFPRQFPGPRY